MTMRLAMKSGVLARLDHPREPVDRGVRVRRADRLDERGDGVVVAVAGLVVVEGAALERLLHERAVDALATVRSTQRDLGREFDAVEGDAGIAGGDLLQEGERVGIERGALVAEPALGVGERASDDLRDLVVAERVEREDAGAGEERGDDLERRVLGGRADEGYGAVLDVGGGWRPAGPC